MKKIFLLVMTGILFGCSSEEIICCTIVDVEVAVKYVNADGENLLELENGLTENNITLYHKIDGEWVRYFKANLDNPDGISIEETGDGKYLMIMPSTTIVENNYSETKIEFSRGQADVLRTQINKKSPNVIVTKVWYNGILKWEKDHQTLRFFEIVK